MPMWVGIDYFSGVKSNRKYFCRKKTCIFRKLKRTFVKQSKRQVRLPRMYLKLNRVVNFYVKRKHGIFKGEHGQNLRFAQYIY